jgi:hypothetical protein
MFTSGSAPKESGKPVKEVAIVAQTSNATSLDQEQFRPRLRLRLQAVLVETLTVLTHIRQFAVATQPDPNARGELSEALNAIFGRKVDGITDRLNAAEQLLAEDAHLAEDLADALARIWNAWEDLLESWESRNTKGLDTQLFIRYLDAIIVKLGILTVPARINKNLRLLRVGAAMNFQTEFKELLPSPEIRAEVLTWIQEHPVSVCGVVNTTTGTIVKAAPTAHRRAFSCCLILTVAIGICVMAAFSSRWLDELHVGTIPLNVTNHDYVWAMVFGYAGALFHIVVAILKQQKGTAPPSRDFAAIGNLAIWIHVHEGYLIWYTLVIPVAVYALILASGQIMLPTLFFLGYSIDSVLDIFLDRFDSFSQRQTEIITNSIR